MHAMNFLRFYIKKTERILKNDDKTCNILNNYYILILIEKKNAIMRNFRVLYNYNKYATIRAVAKLYILKF